MTAPLLTVKDLSIRFAANKPPVVDRLNFALPAGKCLGLVGESGSGKSLTALAIMQLLPAAARVSLTSQIHFAGTELLTQSERQMRRIRGQGIGMIFQDAMVALNPVFTIGNQLIEVIRLHRKVSDSRAQKMALDLLNQVGIQHPKHALASYPHQLSGGMRQRAMIAMALSCEPKLLIADEPTTALDVTIQAQILDLLVELQRREQMTLLFISHDLAVISKLADDIVVLQSGKMVEHAAAQTFFQQPQSDYSKALIAAIPGLQAKPSAASTTEPLLKIQNLKVHFPIRKGILRRIASYVKAVDGVSLHIPQGQTLALVGESGSGKSTTGKAILQLLPATAGRVTFADKNLTLLPSSQLKLLRKDMQIIFQDPYSALNPRMLIVDSLAEGLITLGKARNRKQALQQIDNILQEVQLPEDSKWRYPHEFSGGQRQRICIARALVLQPKLLVLDEPTSALDVSIQMQILNLLKELQQRLGLTYLLITHNLGVVAYMADYLAVMYRGKIVEQGTAQAILHNPQADYTRQLLASIPQIEAA